MDADFTLDELHPERLAELLRLLEAAGVEELEVEANGGRLFLRRELGIAASPIVEPPLAPACDSVTVLAPAVGVFHRGTEEGAPPLAAEGEAVTRGQVLAVVEVLRMPHPVEAPVAGRVERFAVDDGQPVEYGQPLLVIAPSAAAEAEPVDSRQGA